MKTNNRFAISKAEGVIGNGSCDPENEGELMSRILTARPTPGLKATMSLGLWDVTFSAPS